jgi:hypothetical protein
MLAAWQALGVCKQVGDAGGQRTMMANRAARPANSERCCEQVTAKWRSGEPASGEGRDAGVGQGAQVAKRLGVVEQATGEVGVSKGEGIAIIRV